MNSRALDFTPSLTPDVADQTSDNTAATNPAAPVRYIAGTRKTSVTWISRVYKLRAVPAPNTRPGKK